MKRAGILSVLMLAIAVAGCNSGGGGGGSEENVQGNYYAQFYEDDNNFGYIWGDAGIYGVDVVQEGSTVTFRGVGLSLSESGALDGDTLSLEYETEDVRVEYQAKFDDTPFQRGSMKFTYLNWTCDDQGTPCYSHYVVHGPRVSPNPENPVLESETEDSFAPVTMSRILLPSIQKQIRDRQE